MEASLAASPPVFAWQNTIVPENEALVLILAPTGSDSSLSAACLREAGLSARVVASVDELCHAIVRGCGAVLLAEEVFTESSARCFFELLNRQPPWSELPVTLVTSAGAAGGERLRGIASFGTPSNVAVLERPFRPDTLVSLMKVALRSRRRQYEIRNLLDQLALARDEAERANNAKDDFLAALSHELRTPLNPVLLVASAAAANTALPPAVREDFAQIARNVELEARLIDDLLDLTRITRGKLVLDRGPVDLHASLGAALATVQGEIDERGLGIELELRADPSVVWADPVRLQQVLWNVLRNAAKFNSPGGSIHVATAAEGNAVTVRIRDTGIGMDAEDLARVFRPFVQGKHLVGGRRHRFGGLGLGLAITRQLVELHGGSIRAVSAGPGQGTTVILTLPQTEPEPETATRE